MICIISGTNRTGSGSLKLAKVIERMYQDMGATTCLLDLANLPAELFTSGAYAQKPEIFTSDFVAPLLESNGLVVVCPEYNGSFPGVLKYFIDMLPFPESFECRPVAFVGLAAGQFGGLRPVEHLQQIFGYRNAHVFNRRVFIAAAHKVMNADGELTDSALELRLREQCERFIAYIRSVQS